MGIYAGEAPAERDALPVGAAYDQIAPVYDLARRTPLALAEQSVAIDMLVRSGATRGAMLDIGCGTGELLRDLAIPFGRYTGIDVSEGMLAEARRKFPRHIFFRMSMDELLQRDPRDGETAAQFDSIVSLCALSYSMQPALAINGIFHALRPGGRFFVMVYGSRYPKRKTVMDTLGQRAPSYRTYTPDALRNYFHGFEEVEISGFHATIEDLLPESSPEWLFRAALRSERAVWPKALGDYFFYQIVTGRRSHGSSSL